MSIVRNNEPADQSQFMMDFSLKLEKPALKIAWIEGFVMGISYFFGNLKVTSSGCEADYFRRPFADDTLLRDEAHQ